MQHGARTTEPRHPTLFDQEPPRIEIAATQKARLAMLLEALLAEIAMALATGEADDEQDHR